MFSHATVSTECSNSCYIRVIERVRKRSVYSLNIPKEPTDTMKSSYLKFYEKASLLVRVQIPLFSSGEADRILGDVSDDKK